MAFDATIIIAAWNAESFIEKAISSALAQVGISIEVIVADDASIDRTGDVVHCFRDARLNYIRLLTNGGPSAARNAGIEVARGKWIAVLDADDAMLPTRLADLIGAAESGGLDIITDNMWVETVAGARQLFFEEHLDETIECPDFREYVLRNLLFARQRGDGYLKPIFNTAFLREHALRYDPAMRVGEDFMLMAEALIQGARYGRRRSAGYIYSTQAGSISHRLLSSHAQSMIRADRRFLARYGAGLTPFEVEAMRAHLRCLLDGAGFVAMVDAIKAGDMPALGREIVRRPFAIRHFRLPIAARLGRLRFAT
jgi:succinoglycan biosynthesis protein ExoO